MFGYVTPIKEQMSISDFALYRAFYCGICKATGSMFGQLPRLTTNYDMAFLSVLLHDFAIQELEFENSGCILNPFKKKTTIRRNGLLDKIVCTNIILSYYKLCDGVTDKEGVKHRIARKFLTKAYKKAKKILPEIDETVKKGYNKLYALEKENCSSLDRVCDCFASILEKIAFILLDGKADENILRLCYNIGKFVYLTDALDDVDEDFKKKRYNPLLKAYPNFLNRRQYMEQYKDELEFILAITVNRAIECCNKLRLTQSADLIYNIVHKGLRGKVEELFSSEKKLKVPRL